MAGAVAVKGLRELQRDLKSYDNDLGKSVRKTLREAAKPVSVLAQGLIAANIANIGPVWQGVRVGVTTSAVYIAPKARRKTGTGRPNLAPLLQTQMEAAVDEGADGVVAALELMLDDLAHKNDF